MKFKTELVAHPSRPHLSTPGFFYDIVVHAAQAELSINLTQEQT